MATRARVPQKNADKTPNPYLTAAALPLSPARVSPLSDGYNRTVDYLINSNEDGADRMAFHYYRTIPELHYLVSLVGAALSQVKLFIGEVDGDSADTPKAVGPRHPARQLLKDFAGGTQGQADLLGKLGIHLTVTGDSVLIGPGPSGGLQYPWDQWKVWSTQEVSSRSGKIWVRMPQYKDEQIPDTAFAVRIWKEAPDSMWHADSPVKSAFTVLREIELLDAHVHATAISRLKGAGILGIPEELTLPGDEMEIEGEDSDPFIRVLTEVMALAIKNPDSAAALVPIILRGPAEFIDKIKLIDFTNQFDQQVTELRNNALRRLALGMDAPPEVLLGSSSSAGWSMWQVSESQLRLHIKPLAHLIARSLTIGWLKPALDQLPLADATRESLENIVIWPDFSQLTIRPDVGQDAGALYTNFEIAGDTYRHVLGLGEDEKPEPKELEYMIYLHTIRANPAMAAWAIKGLSDHFNIPFINPDGAQAVGGAGDSEADMRKSDAEAEKAEAEAKAAKAGLSTPPKPAETGKAPQIPGDRSTANQTAAEKAPPADGDSSNNQSASPGK